MKVTIPLFFVLVTFQAFAAEEPRTSSIGYGSVEEALSSLRGNPDASIRVEQEWTIIQVKEKDETSIWSFAPPSHPAYPAAVKRSVFEKDGAVYIDMNALCQAEKKECDLLIEQFKQLNERVRSQMNGGA